MNQAARTESYPFPCIDDLFASLNGGKTFTTLDLAHVYQQILLDEESKKLVVISTHKGLFYYNRLPFEVASAPIIFKHNRRYSTKDSTRLCIPRRYTCHGKHPGWASAHTRRSLGETRSAWPMIEVRQVCLYAVIRGLPGTHNLRRWTSPIREKGACY